MKQLSIAGLSTVQILTWIYLIAFACFAFHLIGNQQTFLVSKSVVIKLIVCGVLSYIGNYFMMKAMASAPNTGYAMAIVNLDALLLVFLATLILGEHISWLKALGTLLCVAGVSLLTL